MNPDPTELNGSFAIDFNQVKSIDILVMFAETGPCPLLSFDVSIIKF